MESSVAELMQNLKRLEDLTNFQMSELASVRQEILSVKWKTTRYSEKSKELESALNSNRVLLSSKQFDLMLLEHREKTLKEEMLPEKMKAMEVEKNSLEQLHNDIWQARRDFCEKAKEFNKRNGFLASNFDSNEEEAHEQVNSELLPKVNDEELDMLVAEIASLEKELITINTELFTFNEKLTLANNEIEMLMNEPTSGADFIRLQEARAYSQNQVDLMESRCKKVQDEINSNEKILQSLTLEQRAPEPVYHDYANTRNRYTNQPNKIVTQTFSTKQTGTSKLVEDINKTVDIETTRQAPLVEFKRKTPSKVTFARNDQYVPDKDNELAEKLLVRAENRMNEMQAARDSFLQMKSDAGKMIKTGVTADWLQARPALPKASITENHSLQRNEIPKKRSFVPKQPSVVASLLGATNKMLPSYENKYSASSAINKLNTFAQKFAQPIPTRPTRDEVIELESSTEPDLLPIDKFENPKPVQNSSKPSILKPQSRMPYIS